MSTKYSTRNRTKKHLFKKIFREIIRFPLNCLYNISGLLPKREDIWVFGSSRGHVFKDNAKYFFLYISDNYPKIKATWISKNRELVKSIRKKGYRSYYRWSLKGIYLTLRAKFIVYDITPNSINRYLANGINIQLWHGIPFKKISFDIRDENFQKSMMYNIYNSKGLKRFFYKIVAPFVLRREDCIISTSPLIQEIFAKAFLVEKNEVLISGYPRNDVLLKDIKGMEIFVDQSVLDEVRERKRNGSKILMYMPTFRDIGDIEPTKILNLKSITTLLNELNAILILKYHERSSLSKLLTKTSSTLNKESNNILICDPNSDAYPILKEVDLLITDYSSVFFDFLLIDKPILFYSYDLKEYLTKNRKMYFDYKEIVPGQIVNNFEMLMSAIKKIMIKDEDKFDEKRKLILDKFHTYNDNESSSRLFNLLAERYDLKHLQ